MKKILAILIVMGLGASVNASTVFTFHGGETGVALDGNASASATVDELTLSATVGHSASRFNDTQASFGIDADGSDDVTDKIDYVDTNNNSQWDSGETTEYFTFSFDKATTVTRFDLGGFTDSEGDTTWDAAYINFATHTGQNIDKLGNDDFTHNGSDYLDGNWSVDADEMITMGWSGEHSGAEANGFYVDSITVIPEPTTFALFAALGAFGLLRRRLFRN